jgi:flagellar hook-length control protein FliK
VPRVVADLSAHASHPGLGSRSRPGGAGAKPPESPFAQLLDKASDPPPAPPRDHSERAPAGPAAVTAAASASRADSLVADATRVPEAPASGQQLEGAAALQIISPPNAAQIAVAVASGEDGNAATDDDDNQDVKTAVAEAAETMVSSGDPNAGPDQPASAPPAAVAPASPAIASAAPEPAPDGSVDSPPLAGPSEAMNNTTPSSKAAAATPAPQSQPGQKETTGATAPAFPIASRTADAAENPKAPPALNAVRNPSPGATPAAGPDPAASEARGDARNPTNSVPQEAHHAHLGAAPASRSDDSPQAPGELSAPRIETPPGASAAKPFADGTQMVGMQRPAEPLGNPAAPAATDATPVPIAGLAVEIAARAQAGRNRFEIRLDPPELGRIDVRLDVDGNGQVTSRLLVERTETLDLLRRDAGELERALQQAGLKTNENGLQFALRDQGFAGRNDTGTPPNTARLVIPDVDLAVGETMQTYGRALRANGGIDIRV